MCGCLAQILIEKVKRQLDARRFAEFRQEAAKFLHGEINAEAYHQHVCALGLFSLVPEMASLLPDPMKRAELLSVHEASSSSGGRYQQTAALEPYCYNPGWQRK